MESGGPGTTCWENINHEILSRFCAWACSNWHEQKSKEEKGILISIFSSRLLPFELAMWCSTGFFQGKRNECCRELYMASWVCSYSSQQLQPSRPEHSFSKVLRRTVSVPLKGLLYSGSGKGSASSKVVEFCCWPLGDFTLNVNRTSGRKINNQVEIV